MRNISAASLAKLATKTGTEPVTIVDVAWAYNGQVHSYADRSFPGICEGRILVMSNIEDLINLSNSGTSQSTSITLDDSDGFFLNLLGTSDFHRRPVWIYQWFEGIPITDKFLLFNGVISSPIVYKETDRTITFTVLSLADDIEIGFSAEDGYFGYVPDYLIGKAWPIVFGNISKLPLFAMDDIPHGGNKAGSGANSVTTDATGIHDPSLDKQLEDIQANSTNYLQLAQFYFLGYLQASYTARKYGELDEFDDIQRGRGTFSGLAKQYLDLGNKALFDNVALMKKQSELTATRAAQKAAEKKQIGITNGSNFPQNTVTSLNLNGGQYSGYFIGNTFNVLQAVHPDDEIYNGMVIPPIEQREGDPVITRSKLFFADAGIPLQLASFPPNPDGATLPVRYVVGSGIPITVTAVFAYRQVGEVRSLTVVPDNLYQVITEDFGELIVTYIYLDQPLSGLLDPDNNPQGWDDDLWANCYTSVGPNIVDIIHWLITTYSFYEIDEASFATVRAQVDAYPANFAIQDRPTLIKTICEIAYQSRCNIWLKNFKFYIKYLSIPDPSVATITESDIIHQTLQVETTETENLITKMTGEWKPDYFTNKNYQVIQRYHIANYGVHAQSYNYYIYNQMQLVEKSVSFWLIRSANTFKRVSFQLPFTKLNIESMDTITLNFTHPWISSGPVDCVVENATIDSLNYTMSLVVWVPIRLGELESYIFAFPGIITEQQLTPQQSDDNAGRSIPDRNPRVKLPTSKTGKTPLSGDTGNGGQLHVTSNPYAWGDPTYYTDEANVAPVFDNRTPTGIAVVSQKPPGTKNYQYDKTKTRQNTLVLPTTTVVPGKVVAEISTGIYSVNVYYQGTKNKPTLINNVQQIQINDTDVLLAGTAVLVNQLVYKSADGKSDIIEYYMQAPVWQ